MPVEIFLLSRMASDTVAVDTPSLSAIVRSVGLVTSVAPTAEVLPDARIGFDRIAERPDARIFRE